MCFKYIIGACGTFLVVMCCSFASGCTPNRSNNYEKERGDVYLDDNAVTLQEIVFNSELNLPYKIGIEENDNFVLYLVLTDDYNGNCLLLREHLLDEPMRFNRNGWYSSYYEDSEIDMFLNEEFYKGLPTVVQNNIVDSIIEITDKDSLGIGGKNITTITRKVFLLSYSELNMSDSRTSLKEGKSLTYFSEKLSRIAYYDDGQAGSWWLRTPNTADTAVVCGVSAEGAVGSGGIGGPEGEYLNGVRPAFCLPKDTPVYEDEINGERVFLIVN